MAEDRKIVHIVDTISSISIQQLAVEAIVDADLGFKIWGGKDADGNVTKWLAKDKPIQVTTATLTGGTTTGSDGLVRHDANGLLSGGWILISDLNDLISDADLASILDDAYNNDYGERTVTVDDGDVSWDLAGAYSFNIDLTNTTGGSDGFVVSDTFAEHWKLLRVEDAGIDLEAALKNITYAASAAVILSAGATDDLSFRAREGTVTLNEVGETTLDTTSQSLVGAINELFALDHVVTLDDAYNNDAGAADITVDAGDVIWDVTGDYFFEIDLTNTTLGPENGDGRRGFKVFNATDFFKVVTGGSTIDLDAELEQIDINAAGATSLNGTGALGLNYSNIDLSASTLTIKGTTKITTEAAEDLNLVPGAGGITVIGDAGSPGHLSTPTNDDAYIAGRLEIDDSVYFDGVATFYGHPRCVDNVQARYGTTLYSAFEFNTVQTVDAFGLFLDATSRTLLIAELGDDTFDFAHLAQANSTIFLHSANQSTDEWGSLTHDQTDFLLQTGSGKIKLLPATGNITQIGDAGSTSHGLASNDDLFCAGIFEVDGTSWFDGSIIMDTSVGSQSQFSIREGGSIGFRIFANFNTDQVVLETDDILGNAIVIANADVSSSYDYGHGVVPDPTLFLHSDNASTDEWGSIAHDQTDFIINQGAGTTKLAGGVSLNVTTVNAATYDLLITDKIVHVTYPTTGPVTSLTLPTAQTLSGRNISIIDASGNAGTNSITIDTEGAQTINGAVTYVIDKDYGAASFYSDGTNWFLWTEKKNGTAQPLVAFYATRNSGSQSLTTGVEAIIALPNEDYDDGSDFNVSTYKFTAPTDGYYSFSASADITTGIAGSAELRLYKNTTIIAKGDAGHQTAATIIPCVSCQIKLAATDTVEVRAYQATGFAATLQNVDLHFSGVQIGEI